MTAISAAGSARHPGRGRPGHRQCAARGASWAKRKRLPVRRAVDARFGHDRRHVAGRGDVEGGVGRGHPFRGHPQAPHVGHLLRVALLDGDGRPAGRLGVDRASGGGDVEGDPVRRRQDGQAVGADLVGHVPVGRDAVGAHDHLLHRPPGHEVGGHAVRDQGAGDPRPQQLPGRQARPLQEGAGLVHVDVQGRPPGVGGAQGGQGRPVVDAGQGPGVAVGQHPVPGTEERRPVLPDPAAGRLVLLGDPQRLLHQPAPDLGHREPPLRPRAPRSAPRSAAAPAARLLRHPAHALDAPEQVDRRGARRRQLAAGLLQGAGERRRALRGPQRRQGHPHRRA